MKAIDRFQYEQGYNKNSYANEKWCTTVRLNENGANARTNIVLLLPIWFELWIKLTQLVIFIPKQPQSFICVSHHFCVRKNRCLKREQKDTHGTLSWLRTNFTLLLLHVYMFVQMKGKTELIAAKVKLVGSEREMRQVLAEARYYFRQFLGTYCIDSLFHVMYTL